MKILSFLHRSRQRPRAANKRTRTHSYFFILVYLSLSTNIWSTRHVTVATLCARYRDFLSWERNGNFQSKQNCWFDVTAMFRFLRVKPSEAVLTAHVRSYRLSSRRHVKENLLVGASMTSTLSLTCNDLLTRASEVRRIYYWKTGHLCDVSWNEREGREALKRSNDL